MERTTSGSNNQHSFKWFEAHCQHPNGQTNTSTFVSFWVEVTVANIHLLQLAPVSSLHFFVATARYPCFFYLPHPPLTSLLLFHQFPRLLSVCVRDGGVCLCECWCSVVCARLRVCIVESVAVSCWSCLPCNVFSLLPCVWMGEASTRRGFLCVSGGGCVFILMWDAAYLRFFGFWLLAESHLPKIREMCTRSDVFAVSFQLIWHKLKSRIVALSDINSFIWDRNRKLCPRVMKAADIALERCDFGEQFVSSAIL